jgi:5-methylcytosine-specific restriction endonuclease McrA
VRVGWLVRPDACEDCGRVGDVEAHHHLGYEPEQWTDVRWLCTMCHAAAERLRACDPGHRQTVSASALRVLRACWGMCCARCATEKNLEWDHIKSLSQGGVHCLGNLQRLCRSCNVAKGTTFADYRSLEQITWVLTRVLGSGWSIAPSRSPVGKARWVESLSRHPSRVWAR